MKALSIGREQGCDIVINDSTDVISRRHAILNISSSGKITIVDQSRNGTYVNGIRISQNVPVPVTRKDIISFDNMLEMGVKVIFAKDGTDAMDPSLYLTEEESAVIGKWAAESVEELLGDGPQTSMEGVDNINDALRLDFKSDRNVTVIYKGEEIGTFPWSVALGYCSIESENPSLIVMINDDGTLKVDYSDDDDYYTFHCVKSDSE